MRPLYIEATGTTAVPELQLVIVGVGPEVVIADSFEAALASAIPGLNVDLERVNLQKRHRNLRRLKMTH